MLIGRLLSPESGLKLPREVVFVFNSSIADKTVPVEMSAEKVITSVNDERFAKVFDASVKPESKREVHVLGVELQDFINLLR